MFTVKWVVKGREKEPLEVEEFVVNGREVLLEACQDRLPAMRLKYPNSPPDGFLVFDGAAEVGHRFGANVSPRIAMLPTHLRLLTWANVNSRDLVWQDRHIPDVS